MAALRTLVVGVMLTLATAALAVAVVPETVSPGVVGAVARVAGVCPSFSWGAVEGSQTYELVVYALSATADAGRPVLTARIPGSALSWTPSLDDCLEPGGRYVWFVRSLGSKSTGGWSEGRAFEIEEGPTIAEVEEALRVLERFIGVGGGRDANATGSNGESSEDAEDVKPETELPAPTAEPQAVTAGVEIAETAITIGGADVVTTATDQDTLGGMSCADGQLAKFHSGSSSWVCGAYLAGNQLFLDIDMFHVEEGSGSDLDADLLDGYDSVDFAQLAAASAFTANPLNETVGGGPFYINPANGVKEDYTLLGAAIAGSQRFRVDIEGDVELAGSINKGLVVLPEVSGGSGFASPNVLAGHLSNQVTTGVAGAGIGGGGGRKISSGVPSPNLVTDDFGTVGGGLGNRAGDAAGTTFDKRFSTVGGGSGNTASGLSSTVGGGGGNQASADLAFVGGGSQNTASGIGSSVGGGQYNSAGAEGSTVAGGDNNSVTDRWGSVVGGAYNVAGDNAGTADDEEFGAVGGGFSNEARASHGTVGGGNDNLVSDRYGTVGGGSQNQAGDAAGTTSDRTGATVAGGLQNLASGEGSAIGGGGGNTATGYLATISGGGGNSAAGSSATVAGGSQNQASGLGATVGGGQFNIGSSEGSTIAGGDNNTVTDRWGTVAGGAYNQAGDGGGSASDEEFAAVGGGFSNEAGANYATIGGGNDNLVTDQYGTVGGGFDNQAGDDAGTTLDAKEATIGGGRNNMASGHRSTVGGGGYNVAALGPSTVAGGEQNEASGWASTVGGGDGNSALGLHSTVAGGADNGAAQTNASVGGGSNNYAGGEGSTVSGGYTNSASADWTVVGGGSANVVSAEGGTIGGGAGNLVRDSYGTIAGGEQNKTGDADNSTDLVPGGTVGGGKRNTASGIYATIAGGVDNSATGHFSFVAGGQSNHATGSHTFVGGANSYAPHDHSFVWNSQSTAADQFAVEASGGLRFRDSSGLEAAASFVKGTGTPGTGAALEVFNSTNFGEVAWFRQDDPLNVQPVLKLILPKGIGANDARNFLECEIVGDLPPRKCHINKFGTFVAGSDFAEALPALGERGAYEPGDVLLMAADGSGVETVAQAYSPRVAGVYSTRPGVLGADKGGETRVDEQDVPVAIVGIVPTKVSGENGSIEVGDLLVSSGTSGHAMKGTDQSQMQGAVVGKALEPFKGETGVIRVLVSLL